MTYDNTKCGWLFFTLLDETKDYLNSGLQYSILKLKKVMQQDQVDRTIALKFVI